MTELYLSKTDGGGKGSGKGGGVKRVAGEQDLVRAIRRVVGTPRRNDGRARAALIDLAATALMWSVRIGKTPADYATDDGGPESLLGHELTVEDRVARLERRVGIV